LDERGEESPNTPEHSKRGVLGKLLRVIPGHRKVRGANRDVLKRKLRDTLLNDRASSKGNLGGETAKSRLSARANQEICKRVELLER